MKTLLTTLFLFSFAIADSTARSNALIAGDRPTDLVASILLAGGGLILHNNQINNTNPLIESDHKDYLPESIPPAYLFSGICALGVVPFWVERAKGLHHFRGFAFVSSANFFLYGLVSSMAGRHRPNYEAALAAGEKAEKKSFYSGHAALSFSATTYSALYLHDHLGEAGPAWLCTGGLFGLSIYVAFTRWNEHYHHPSDLVAGAVVGTAISCMGYKVYEKRKKGRLSMNLWPGKAILSVSF